MGHVETSESDREEAYCVRRRSRRRQAALLACTCLIIAVPSADAQLQAGADIGYRTRYVWRGLTFVDGPVVQPAVFLALQSSSSVITAGVWSNVDVSKRESSSFGVRWFGESNVWVDYTARLAPIQVSAGWVGYFFDLDESRGLLRSRVNSHELYGAARVTWNRIETAVTAWYDFDRVKGLYVEGDFAVRVPMWNGLTLPLGSLWVTAEVGLNVGQDRGTGITGKPGYFFDRGVTHYAIGISTTMGYFPMGVISGAVQLEVGWIQKEDARARLRHTGLGGSARAFYFGLTITAVGPRCRPTKTICSR